MSQEYIASFSRGDQSSNPFLQPSLMADISDPVICDSLFCSGVADISGRSKAAHIVNVYRLPFSLRTPSLSISTRSTKKAIPSMGSAQSGPWRVAI